MSLYALLGQEATMTRWTYVEDAYGNKVRSAASTSSAPARLEQTDSTEISVGRSTEISNHRVFLPPDVDLDAEDQVTIDGRVFEVIGLPALERSPRGPHHVMARLRFVE